MPRLSEVRLSAKPSASHHDSQKHQTHKNPTFAAQPSPFLSVSASKPPEPPLFPRKTAAICATPTTNSDRCTRPATWAAEMASLAKIEIRPLSCQIVFARRGLMLVENGRVFLDSVVFRAAVSIAGEGSSEKCVFEKFFRKWRHYCFVRPVHPGASAAFCRRLVVAAAVGVNARQLRMMRPRIMDNGICGNGRSDR